MNKNCIAREMVATLSVVGPKDAKGYKGRNFSFHSLFSGVKVLGAALVWSLLFFSCTSGRDLGYVYGNLEPAYYPKRFHIPGLVDVQKGSKREKIKF